MTFPMEKAFLDPVHGFILINEQWLLRLVDSVEFQRLRRIRQLGASFGTYHGAEHTRFGHSLGAMHIMQRMLSRFEQVHGPIDEKTHTIARVAALLHDVGHGPLSHCLEYLLTPEVSHEYWTKRILLEDTDVNRILRTVDASLPEKVVEVIDRRSETPWVNDLVSGQLDVDRMDYLLRDALYTGAEYGRFQLDRIVNTVVLHDGQVAVRQKGLQAIEEYVLARHFMYWRVYLHKTIRGSELLLRAAVKRARRLVEELGEDIGLAGSFARFFSGNGVVEVDVHDYLHVDDADLFVALKQWTRSDDKVLADLSERFLTRRLLKPVFSTPVGDVTDELRDEARDVVAKAGYDPDYYCLIDNTANVPYDTYAHSEPGVRKQPIVVRDRKSNELIEISKLSPLIEGLAALRVRAINVYVPEQCRAAVAEVAAKHYE